MNQVSNSISRSGRRHYERRGRRHRSRDRWYVIPCAGVDRIDINPGLSSWLHNDQPLISKYDAVIGHIRSRGLEIALNPQFTPGDLTIESFAAIRELIQRYGQTSGL